MAAIGVFIGTHSPFTDDEAGMVLQEQAVAQGHWGVPDAFPRVDPEHQDFALQGIGYTAAGFAPIGRHLTYSLIVAPVVRVGGANGLTAISMLCTVLAALCSARLARMYAPGHERLAFWATAVGSPLFFYGFVDTGQTAGAAAVAACTVAAIAFLRGGRFVTLAAAGVAMGLAVAARYEAMIWCAAACLASPLLIRRRGRAAGYSAGRVVLLVASLAGGGLLVCTTDSYLVRAALGGSQGFAQPVSKVLGGYSLTSHLEGFLIAASGAGHGADPWSQLHLAVLPLTLIGLGLTVLAARMLRDRAPATLLAAAAGLAASCFLVRGFVEPSAPVAGLLPAFPLLVAGLWLLGRSELRSPEARWAAGAALVFAAGVGASVDSSGGGLQSGGRYFGIALPVIVPLMAAIARHGAALSGSARRVVAGCLVVATAATFGQSVATLTAFHRGGTGAMTEMAAAAPQAVPGDGGKPVVVSTSVALGSLYAVYPDYRLLRASDQAALAELGRRLIGVGVQRVIVAGYDVNADLASLAGSYRPIETIPRKPSDDRWATAVVVADAS